MSLFKNKDFLLLMIARLIINFADSLFYIVAIWYTSKTLGSPYYTSLAVFVFLLPETLVFFVGPIVDRVNPKRILIFSLCSQLILMFILVVFFENLGIGTLLFIMMVSAFMSVITYPVEDTMIPQLVECNELVAANSMLSITYKIFDSLFNGISGFLLATFSTVALLKLNLVIFVIPVFVVIFIRFIYQKSEEEYTLKEYFTDLKDGVMFIKSSTVVYMLIPLIFVNFFNASNAVILPFFCQEYSEAARTFGIIMAISGIGGMTGAFLINYFKNYMPVGKLLSILLILNGVFWIMFILTRGMKVSYVFVFIAYSFFGMYNVIYESLFQSITPTNFLGRVSTAIDTTITIAMPLGSIFGGVLLKILPHGYSMMFSGISVIITGIFYYKFRKINSLPYIGEVEKLELTS